MVAINGDPTEGWDGDRAAKSLRGRTGSSVIVRFARRSDQVPGVAGRPEQPPRVEVHQVPALRWVEAIRPLATQEHGSAGG